ncbi:hypothetical protein PN466_04130 [Roseofilum reptotaenium CS-1145]|uniref:Uncharacterized protein n=1 Tax=Roseofilum reptotaenium AO1-A TaxID=1925591 RepID=A0A1L9QXQ8_9CYAN|nr:hypothetical protein [Roseofilum reptotaenium]MDB9516147.1 hypothetical protein [Roseofilum reptotaenium CS-1145]OJJ27377.1 hypothetical protein BI308_02550 [Roseofilum reptotaenium AO1-A]
MIVQTKDYAIRLSKNCKLEVRRHGYNLATGEVDYRVVVYFFKKGEKIHEEEIARYNSEEEARKLFSELVTAWASGEKLFSVPDIDYVN